MNINVEQPAKSIIHRLNSAGYEAFAVGGCVRDKIMGREVTDFDITTSALPNQIKTVFSDCKIIETGIKHGTVTVIYQNVPFEITTYRSESVYTDSRHPDKVTFVMNITDDLSRRDFTMNAVAISPREGIIDPFGGVNDINNKTIRAVGDPEKRFAEDALRILRALRFSSSLGFKIEENTSKAIFHLQKTVLKVSPERIYSELQRLVCGINARSVIEEYRSVFLNVISVNDDISKLDILPSDFSMRMAYLCGNNGLESLNFLRADNETKKKVKLILNSEPIPENNVDLKLYISRIGKENALYISNYRRIVFGEDNANKTKQIINDCRCLTLSDLAINGNDLLAFGIKGENIRKTLEMLLVSVITEETDNLKEQLLEKLKDIDNLLN